MRNAVLMGLGQIVPAVRWCIPWQQRCRINALAILDNPAKDPYQVTVEVNIVQLAGLSQRGQDRSRLAAFFAADEQHIVAQQDGVLELALDGVVVEFNAAIFDECQRRSKNRPRGGAKVCHQRGHGIEAEGTLRAPAAALFR